MEGTIAKLEAAQAKDAPMEPDPEAHREKTLEVMSVLRSPDVSEEAKNIALRSIIDRIVFNKQENTFDIYFLPDV